MSKFNAKTLAEAIAAALAPVLVALVGDNDDADTNTKTEKADKTEKAEKRGPGRPAGSGKAAGKTTKAPKEEEEESDDGLGDDDDDLGLGEEEEEVTQEDVVNAFKALKASKGIEKCREVLAKIDESNVLNIPAKKYAEALKEINRAASKK